MKNRLTKMFIVLTMTLSLIAMGLPQQKAAAATTAADVIVKVGQMGADSYSQSLNGVLYTVDQIGFMADRIVYVTEFSQDNSIKVIYMATSLWPTGTKDGGYTYNVALMPVAMLPAGW